MTVVLRWSPPVPAENPVAVFAAVLAVLALLLLNGVWIRARSSAVDEPTGQPSGPAARAGYLRAVILPILVLCALWFVAYTIVAVTMHQGDTVIFLGRFPAPVERLVVIVGGAALMALAIVILNCAWMWTWRRVVRGVFAIGWTAICVFLFVVFWTPVDRNAYWSPDTTLNHLEEPICYIDRQLWPYHGTSESTVSLVPAAPTYRRLVIREEAEASIRGYGRADFVGGIGRRRADILKFTYKLELEPLRAIDGQSNFEIMVDALNGMNWRSQGNQGGHRSGSPLDAEVVAEWLREASPGDAKPEEIDAQARAIVGIVNRAANYKPGNEAIRGTEGRQTVSRLDVIVGVQMGTIPFGKPMPFRTWNAAKTVKLEPTVPILYIGVPLMLTVWGVGLWLLLRRRRVAPDAGASIVAR